jgi:hypothetical protein
VPIPYLAGLQTDIAEAEEDFQITKPPGPLSIVARSVGVVFYGLKTKAAWSNNYYWYEKGFNATRTLSLIATLYWDMKEGSAPWDPMYPWDRYSALL